MIIGFSGTRNGMTKEQLYQLNYIISTIENIKEVHIGDCLGADAQFHRLMKDKVKTIGHPPIKKDGRAFCKYDEEWEKKEYLDRNKEIIECSDLLIATPDGQEKLRSGTWATVRYARKKEIQIIIISPDGTIMEEKKNGKKRSIRTST